MAGISLEEKGYTQEIIWVFKNILALFWFLISRFARII